MIFERRESNKVSPVIAQAILEYQKGGTSASKDEYLADYWLAHAYEEYIQGQGMTHSKG